MMNKRILHCDVETVGGFDPKARTIWACAYIVTDAVGNELERHAYLIQEALPFLAGDTFWSARKNSMMCKVLCDYETITAREFWVISSRLFFDCQEFWAFNSRFELGAFENFARSFRLHQPELPPVYDLALWAFDALPISKYAAWALEAGAYSDSKKSLSSKCEHILAWLIADGKIVQQGEHNHLALSDTLTQVQLFQVCRATKKRKPDAGVFLTHFAHPAWRKWLRLESDSDATDGARYVQV